MALAKVGPITVAVAIEPDVEIHAVEGGVGGLAHAHSELGAFTVEKAQVAVAPAIIAAVVVGHIGGGPGHTIAQNVIARCVLVRPLVSFGFTGEKVAQPGLHGLVVMAWPSSLIDCHIAHRRELAEDAARVSGVVNAVMVGAVRRIAQIGAGLAIIGGQGVVDNQLGTTISRFAGLFGMGRLEHTPIAPQGQAVIDLCARMPALDKGRNIPVDKGTVGFAGAGDRLELAAPGITHWGRASQRRLIPEAINPANFHFVGTGVDAGKVEAQTGRVDRCIHRQHREIKLEQAEMHIGMTDPEEARFEGRFGRAPLGARIVGWGQDNGGGGPFGEGGRWGRGVCHCYGQ